VNVLEEVNMDSVQVEGDRCLLEFFSLSFNLNPSGLITSAMSSNSSASIRTGLQVG